MIIIRVGARPATVSCVSAGRSRTARKHDPARFYIIDYTVYVSSDGVFIADEFQQCL